MLASSGEDRFASLDHKMSAGLTICTKDARGSALQLYEDLLIKEGKAIEKGTIVKGRQIIHMILSFFKTNHSLDLVYSAEDLAALEWHGDKDMHTFRHMWTMYTAATSDVLT